MVQAVKMIQAVTPILSADEGQAGPQWNEALREDFLLEVMWEGHEVVKMKRGGR